MIHGINAWAFMLLKLVFFINVDKEKQKCCFNINFELKETKLFLLKD